MVLGIRPGIGPDQLKFGHNDQKAANNISVAKFSTNLKSKPPSRPCSSGNEPPSQGSRSSTKTHETVLTCEYIAMAAQVKAAGGIPILVTSLSRRVYTSGVIRKDLIDQVTATLAVASEIKADVIDLNAASMAYLNSIGEANARNYDLAKGDSTHLNAAAIVLFGNMVTGLISSSKLGDAVKQFLKEDAQIAAAISSMFFPSLLVCCLENRTVLLT